MKRKGMGKGKGMGYYNLVPRDSYVHRMSAKGVSTRVIRFPKVRRDILPQDIDMMNLEKEGYIEVDSDGRNVTFEKLSESGQNKLDKLQKEMENLELAEAELECLEEYKSEMEAEQYSPAGFWDSEELDQVESDVQFARKKYHEQKKKVLSMLNAKGKRVPFGSVYGAFDDKEKHRMYAKGEFTKVEDTKDFVQFKDKKTGMDINVKKMNNGVWVVASVNPNKGGWKEHGYDKNKKKAIKIAKEVAKKDLSELHAKGESLTKKERDEIKRAVKKSGLTGMAGLNYGHRLTMDKVREKKSFNVKAKVVGFKGKKDLRRTNKKTKIIGKNDNYVERSVYEDSAGQRYVKFDGKYWKYPQGVEF